jgi:cytochrome c peroxidase
MLGLPHKPSSTPDVRLANLGRHLFMDRRLSPNDTMSCGMCHVPEQGFTVNEIATAVGLEGRSLRRNAPTVINVGLQRTLFHDGRSASLEDQVWGPLLARDEMGNASKRDVVRRIAAIPRYRRMFRAQFPGKGITPGTIASALAAYERSLASGDSAFDRHRFADDLGALSESARRGLALFEGKAGCVACHRIEPDHAALTDHAFHNTGTATLARSRRTAGYAVELAPGVYTHMTHAEVAAAFGETPVDRGREEVTRAEADRDRFKTPSLRNVALTAPYMHDGSIATLEDVVAYYDGGGANDPSQDPRVRPLGLDDGERRDLVSFLRSLTGSNVDSLARAARAAASTPVFRPGRPTRR